MKQFSDENTKYFYCHTKGIKTYGTPQENNVIDWIKLMLYWNVNKWKYALNVLNDGDTYGCIYLNTPKPHYSGNFFWVTGTHLRHLENYIGNESNDPEFWILAQSCLSFNSYSSTVPPHFGHYDNKYPEELYNTL